MHEHGDIPKPSFRQSEGSSLIVSFIETTLTGANSSQQYMLTAILQATVFHNLDL